MIGWPTTWSAVPSVPRSTARSPICVGRPPTSTRPRRRSAGARQRGGSGLARLAAAAMVVVILGAALLTRAPRHTTADPAASTPAASPAPVAAPPVPSPAGPCGAPWAASVVALDVRMPAALVMTLRGESPIDAERRGELVRTLRPALDLYRGGEYGRAATALATLAKTHPDVPRDRVLRRPVAPAGRQRLVLLGPCSRLPSPAISWATMPGGSRRSPTSDSATTTVQGTCFVRCARAAARGRATRARRRHRRRHADPDAMTMRRWLVLLACRLGAASAREWRRRTTITRTRRLPPPRCATAPTQTPSQLADEGVRLIAAIVSTRRRRRSSAPATWRWRPVTS